MLVESIEECVRSHFLPGTRNFLAQAGRHSFPEPGSSIGSFHSVAGCSQAPPRQ